MNLSKAKLRNYRIHPNPIDLLFLTYLACGKQVSGGRLELQHLNLGRTDRGVATKLSGPLLASASY